MVAAHEGARALQHAGALRCRAGERTQGTRTGAIKVTLHGVRREKSEKAEGCETWGPVLSSRPLYYASFFVKRWIFSRSGLHMFHLDPIWLQQDADQRKNCLDRFKFIVVAFGHGRRQDAKGSDQRHSCIS